MKQCIESESEDTGVLVIHAFANPNLTFYMEVVEQEIDCVRISMHKVMYAAKQVGTLVDKVMLSPFPPLFLPPATLINEAGRPRTPPFRSPHGFSSIRFLVPNILQLLVLNFAGDALSVPYRLAISTYCPLVRKPSLAPSNDTTQS